MSEWIPHDGGPMPVDGGERVHIKLRGGAEDSTGKGARRASGNGVGIALSRTRSPIIGSWRHPMKISKEAREAARDFLGDTVFRISDSGKILSVAMQSLINSTLDRAAAHCMMKSARYEDRAESAEDDELAYGRKECAVALAYTAGEILASRGHPMTDAWQPIASAPRDWTSVIAYDPNLEDITNDRGVFLAWFNPDEECWCSSDRTEPTINPTLWIALPTPPTTPIEAPHQEEAGE